jgi:hypothetical protein
MCADRQTWNSIVAVLEGCGDFKCTTHEYNYDKTRYVLSVTVHLPYEDHIMHCKMWKPGYGELSEFEIPML